MSNNTMLTRMKAQDVRQAEAVMNKLDQARLKAAESKKLLAEAHAIASRDSYQSVVHFDAPEIRDMEGVLKVAGRNINLLWVRWSDIAHGRRTTDLTLD